MTARRLLRALAVASLVTVGGCGTADGPPSGAAPSLAGRTFLSTSVTGHDIGTSRIRLTFEAGRFSAQAGCNTLGGSVSITDGRFVTGQIASTEMGCDPKLMALDQWLSGFLLAKPALTLAGDTLTLATPEATVVLLDRKVVQPDRPLEGTRWTVDGLIDGVTAASVEAPVPATFELRAGRVSVSTGCNTGSATYSVSGATLTLGPLSLTQKACDAAQMALERAVVATFDQVLKVRIDADALTLSGEAHGLTLKGGAA
jgi:heat shock protein HslJ